MFLKFTASPATRPSSGDATTESGTISSTNPTVEKTAKLGDVASEKGAVFSAADVGSADASMASELSTSDDDMSTSTAIPGIQFQTIW